MIAPGCWMTAAASRCCADDRGTLAVDRHAQSRRGGCRYEARAATRVGTRSASRSSRSRVCSSLRLRTVAVGLVIATPFFAGFVFVDPSHRLGGATGIVNQGTRAQHRRAGRPRPYRRLTPESLGGSRRPRGHGWVTVGAEGSERPLRYVGST